MTGGAYLQLNFDPGLAITDIFKSWGTSVRGTAAKGTEGRRGVHVLQILGLLHGPAHVGLKGSP